MEFVGVYAAHSSGSGVAGKILTGAGYRLVPYLGENQSVVLSSSMISECGASMLGREICGKEAEVGKCLPC